MAPKAKKDSPGDVKASTADGDKAKGSDLKGKPKAAAKAVPKAGPKAGMKAAPRPLKPETKTRTRVCEEGFTCW